MISRRSFLKISGLAAAALGAGYGVGKISEPGELKNFSLHGFLPGDEKVIAGAIKTFNKKYTSTSAPVIYADKQWVNIISKAYAVSGNRNDNHRMGNVTFRMMRMNDKVDADIMLSDSKNHIYNPSDDFDHSFKALRNCVRNMKAEYIFSAEYSESSLFSSLFKSNERIVLIESDKGISDKIKLEKNYKNIEINGPQGKIGISIENGLVRVNAAPCRHQLCRNTGFASKPGDVIACAPNKVLIKIELI